MAGLCGIWSTIPLPFVKVKGGAGVQSLSAPRPGISRTSTRAKHYSEAVGMFFRNVPTSLLLSGPGNTHGRYPAGTRLQQPEAAASPLIPQALRPPVGPARRKTKPKSTPRHYHL